MFTLKAKSQNSVTVLSSIMNLKMADPVHTIRAKVRQVSLQKTGTATTAELHGSLESSALELKRYPSHSAPLKILFPGQEPGQPLVARERLKNAEHDFHVTLFS